MVCGRSTGRLGATASSLRGVLCTHYDRLRGTGEDVGTGPGLYTNIYLYKNNEKVYASRFHLEDRRDSGGDIITQASRSLVLELGVGDVLQLQADLFFNGSIRDLTYCIVLVASL